METLGLKPLFQAQQSQLPLWSIINYRFSNLIVITTWNTLHHTLILNNSNMLMKELIYVKILIRDINYHIPKYNNDQPFPTTPHSHILFKIQRNICINQLRNWGQWLYIYVIWDKWWCAIRKLVNLIDSIKFVLN